MNDLVIKKTQETPEVSFLINGHLLMRGISIPENITIFYSQIFDWLTEFKNNLPNKVIIDFEFEYINTTTTYILIEIINKVIEFRVQGTDVTINWRCEEDDEDIYDIGKLLEYRTKTEFEFEQIKL